MTFHFLASFSGATEDTVAALRHAKAHDARTIAFVNTADSLMGREADQAIGYNSKAPYILRLAGAYLFSLEFACLQGNRHVIYYSNLTAITKERVEAAHEIGVLVPKCGTLWIAIIHICCMDTQPADS